MYASRSNAIHRATAPAVRSGVAALDYILAIGVVFPLLVVILPQGRRAMQLVYEMTATLTAWPFM